MSLIKGFWCAICEALGRFRRNRKQRRAAAARRRYATRRHRFDRLEPLVVLNAAPLASSSSLSVTEDVAQAGAVTATDDDLDDLTYTVVGGPQHGSLDFDTSDGTYIYTPNSDYRGNDSFTFVANDGTVDSDVETISITVSAVNDAPVVAPSTTAEVSQPDSTGFRVSTMVNTPFPVQTSTLNANAIFAERYKAFHSDSEEQSFDVNVDWTIFDELGYGYLKLTTSDSSEYGSNFVAELEPNTLAVFRNDAGDWGAFQVTPINHGDGQYWGVSTYVNSSGLTFSPSLGWAHENVEFDLWLVQPSATGYEDLIDDLRATTIRDPDVQPLGVAITSLPTEFGSWEYTLNNGSSWTSISTAPSSSAAVLLYADASTRLRFVPSSTPTGPMAITYRVWDRTGSGTNGGTGSVTTNGNATPYSAQTITAYFVSDNYAPVAHNAELSVTEDTAKSGTVTATDLDPDTLTYAVVAGPQHGTLTIFDTSTGSYTYTPAANYVGSDSFTFRANDGTVNSALGTVSIQVSAVNDAPTLALGAAGKSTWLNLATESDSGTTITDLLGRKAYYGTWGSAYYHHNTGATSTTGDPVLSYADNDSGALKGVAITAVDSTNGTWQYSLNNGTTWQSIGIVDEANALLLSADATTRVRFTPGTGFFGLVSNALTFRAWDRTEGNVGDKFNIVAHGGITAFSSSAITANVTATLPGTPLATGAAEDNLGRVTAADGAWLAVGAAGSDTHGTNFGAVQIYRLSSSGTWDSPTSGGMLPLPSSVVAGDVFGGSLAVRATETGLRVVIGLALDDTPGSLTDAGAAFVYEGTWDGDTISWTSSQLTPTAGPTAGARFGSIVALDGDTAVVTANGESGGGGVYVFELSGGSWTQAVRLAKPSSDNVGWGSYGMAVAVSGDTLVISSPIYNGSTGNETGRVYVYTKNASGWSASTTPVTLTAPEAMAGGRFGMSLGLTTDADGGLWLAAGSTGREAIYLYHRNHSSTPWTESWSTTPVKLTLPAPQWGTGVGGALAIRGDALAFSAKGLDGTVGNEGAVAVYRLAGGEWVFDRRLMVAGIQNDNLGEAVALTDGWVFAAARLNTSNTNVAGRLYAWNVINRAPEIAPDFISELPRIRPDAVDESGMTVADLLIGSGLSDPDLGSNLESVGIALIGPGTTGLGRWQYNINNQDWVDVDAVGTTSASNALLLSQTSLIRFQPNSSGGGFQSIDFRLWDGSNAAAVGTRGIL